MSPANVIARRDFRSSMAQASTWFFNAAFLLVSGLSFAFFTLQFSDHSLLVRRSGDPGLASQLDLLVAVVQPSARVLATLLLVVVPLFTMRLLSEERRSGTMELLLTAPIKSWSLVWGKYLGGLATVLLPLLLTLWFPLSLMLVASPDVSPIATSYVGLTLAAALFVAVGLFASSLTTSPLLAAFLSFGFLATLALLGAAAEGVEGPVAALLIGLSPLQRLSPFLVGVLDVGSICYFLSGTAAALFLTERILDTRRWR